MILQNHTPAASFYSIIEKKEEGDNMAEITVEQYHECYELAKLVNAEKMSIQEATFKLGSLGVSENSAMMYLRCARYMLEGKRFTSRVKELAISHNLTQIYAEYGPEGLKKALRSVRGYLDYQKKYADYPGLEKVYSEFMDIL